MKESVDFNQTLHKYSLLEGDELVRFWRSCDQGQGHSEIIS